MMKFFIRRSNIRCFVFIYFTNFFNCSRELKVTKISSTYLLYILGPKSYGQSESHCFQNDKEMRRLKCVLVEVLWQHHLTDNNTRYQMWKMTLGNKFEKFFKIFFDNFDTVYIWFIQSLTENFKNMQCKKE